MNAATTFPVTFRLVFGFVDRRHDKRRCTLMHHVAGIRDTTELAVCDLPMKARRLRVYVDKAVLLTRGRGLPVFSCGSLSVVRIFDRYGLTALTLVRVNDDAEFLFSASEPTSCPATALRAIDFIEPLQAEPPVERLK